MIIGISGKMQSGKNTVASIIQYLIYKDKVKNGSLSLDSFLNNTFIGDSYSGFVQKSFAKKLKEIISILTGIPVEDLEKQEVKNRVLGEEWWYYKGEVGLYPYDTPCKANKKLPLVKLTPRLLLQLLGTDCGRNIIHPNIWVNAIMAEYKPIAGTMDVRRSRETFPNWIITDVRFSNELQAIKDRGGIIIRVNRPRIIEHSENVSYKFNPLFDKEHPSETALDNVEFNYVIDNNGNIEELVVKVKEILIKENIIK